MNGFTEEDLKVIRYFNGTDNEEGGYHIEGSQEMEIDVYPPNEKLHQYFAKSYCSAPIFEGEGYADTLAEAMSNAVKAFKWNFRTIQNAIEDGDDFEAELEDRAWEEEEG